ILLQWLTGPAVGEQGIFGGKVLQRKIGGVAVMAMQHHEARLVTRPAGDQQVAGRKPLPSIVVARPCGDTMNVGNELRLRLREKFRKGPEDRVLDRAIDVEPPA